MNSSDDTRAVPERARDPGIATSLPEELAGYFKILVGQIELALPTEKSRVLLLSSSSIGEGTTEVTIGLALTLATAMGRKTAVIDCNVHHPEMHLRFGAPEAGLGEYLAGELTLEGALAKTVVPNLHIMPVGKHLVSLVGLGKEETQRFIGELRTKFDYVLIDAAPIGVYPDCAALCDKVDAVILVIRHGDTRREIVKRTKDIIVRTGGKILGVVLNRRRYPIPDFLYRRL
jgi:capsular exopolysaccharide synthesis family protein